MIVNNRAVLGASPGAYVPNELVFAYFGAPIWR